MELFSLICKILLESWFFLAGALDFFFARENLPLRHAVNFSMPCACRGVKEILMMFRHRNAASLGITPKPAWCSALSPLHFCILHRAKIYGGAALYIIYSLFIKYLMIK